MERFKVFYYEEYLQDNGDWNHRIEVLDYCQSSEQAKEFVRIKKQSDKYKDVELRIVTEIREHLQDGIHDWNEIENSDIYDYEVL